MLASNRSCAVPERADCSRPCGTLALQPVALFVGQPATLVGKLRPGEETGGLKHLVAEADPGQHRGRTGGTIDGHSPRLPKIRPGAEIE